MTMYRPIYMPGNEDVDGPTFYSYDKALEYVFANMCNLCIDERAKALRREVDEDGFEYSDYPPCACEWFIDEIEVDKL